MSIPTVTGGNTSQRCERIVRHNKPFTRAADAGVDFVDDKPGGFGAGLLIR